MNEKHVNMGSHAAWQSGFSLIEVLIAIVLLAIGLVGLASMQVTGLMNNQSAYHSSQATVLAYDIADRMRSNSTTLGNYLTSYMTLAEAAEEGAQSGCKTTTGCTPAQLAQNDLLEWNSALLAALPLATGTITLTDGIFTINVNWDDDKDGDVDVDDVSYQMSFEP